MLLLSLLITIFVLEEIGDAYLINGSLMMFLQQKSIIFTLYPSIYPFLYRQILLTESR